MTFVEIHWNMVAMTGMWASPSQSLEERVKFRALFNVKCGIVEIEHENPKSMFAHNKET